MQLSSSIFLVSSCNYVCNFILISNQMSWCHDLLHSSDARINAFFSILHLHHIPAGGSSDTFAKSSVETQQWKFDFSLLQASLFIEGCWSHFEYWKLPIELEESFPRCVAFKPWDHQNLSTYILFLIVLKAFPILSTFNHRLNRLWKYIQLFLAYHVHTYVNSLLIEMWIKFIEINAHLCMYINLLPLILKRKQFSMSPWSNGRGGHWALMVYIFTCLNRLLLKMGHAMPYYRKMNSEIALLFFNEF